LLVRCFSVLMHGAFRPRLNFESEVSPRGFYTTRWTVTSSQQKAVKPAFDSAKRELAGQHPDTRDGLVTVEMQAEDVATGSWWRWLKGGGRGFAFYMDD
jgi:hypothetical protein